MDLKNKIMKLWICGIFKGTSDLGTIWELVGTFDSEKKALNAAKADKNCFIAPVNLNEDYGIELLPEWPGFYYPAYNKV